jgi:glucosamine-6-phosphate deaminase
MPISTKQLYRWCKIPYQELEGHPDLKVPFRLVEDSAAMGRLMARELPRSHPYSSISLEQLRGSTVRIQENNWDTILALAQRSFGTAYQFVPPMSVTLGLKECLSAARVRLFSDTGAWKQTALRVALFSSPDPEYPLTLLQEHPDVLITATVETAAHPISLHPEWDLGLEG